MFRAFDTPPFTAEEMGQILGIKHLEAEAMALAVNNAIAVYAFNRRQNTMPDDRGKAALLRDIAKSCRKTLNLCGVTDRNDQIYDTLGPGALFAAAAVEGAQSGEAAVKSALDAVASLERWANQTEWRHSQRAAKQSPISHRPPNVDMGNLLRALAGAYLQHCDLMPAIYQNDDREPSGSFFDLLVAVDHSLEQLGVQDAVGPSGVAQRWKRLQNGR